ncbi:MAG: hypothetical protein LBE08_07820, partial [Bifidobacteriaceae bacterium]|nr:hypothetical protein [Bifidobacteriaceae bacterium]
MCGIAGLHFHDPALYPRLGELLGGMLRQAAGRGNDSAGVGLYADPASLPPGQATICLLPGGPPAGGQGDPGRLVAAADPALGEVTASWFGQSLVLTAQAPPDQLEAAALLALPGAVVISRGQTLTVLKGTGAPEELATDWRLADRGGWQGVAHTRMATESAVTPAGSHPFSVGSDQCLVHNGS